MFYGAFDAVDMSCGVCNERKFFAQTHYRIYRPIIYIELYILYFEFLNLYYIEFFLSLCILDDTPLVKIITILILARSVEVYRM